MRTFLVFLIFCLCMPLAAAKDQYVIDVLYITLRAGQGDEFKVLRALKSGTRLELIEVSDAGYSLVRTEKGLEGWVKTKYLVDDPVAILQVAELKVANEKLTTKNAGLKNDIDQAKRKVKEAEKERKRLESKSQNLKAENNRIKKASAHPLRLEKENKDLLSKSTDMETELLSLRAEKEKFSTNNSRDWFIAGAGVLILGMVIGLILPSIRWRKKNAW